MNDKHLRVLAAFEQASAFLNIFATFLSSYHKSLCEAGFKRSEALVLVEKVQHAMFDQAFNSDTPSVDPSDDDEDGEDSQF